MRKAHTNVLATALYLHTWGDDTIFKPGVSISLFIHSVYILYTLYIHYRRVMLQELGWDSLFV